MILIPGKKCGTKPFLCRQFIKPRLTTIRQTTFFILQLRKSFTNMEPLALLLLHLDGMLILNLLQPNISLQILHTVLY